MLRLALGSSWECSQKICSWYCTAETKINVKAFGSATRQWPGCSVIKGSPWKLHVLIQKPPGYNIHHPKCPSKNLHVDSSAILISLLIGNTMLKSSRAYKASEIVSEAYRLCFAKVRPVCEKAAVTFPVAQSLERAGSPSFPWIWQQPRFQKHGPKTGVYLSRTWKQVLLWVWFLSWLLKDVQSCNYIMYLLRVMTTTGPQMFTSTRMPTCRKWEMGVGLVVTLDVVNLPLTLFG